MPPTKIRADESGLDRRRLAGSDGSLTGSGCCSPSTSGLTTAGGAAGVVGGWAGGGVGAADEVVSGEGAAAVEVMDDVTAAIVGAEVEVEDVAAANADVANAVSVAGERADAGSGVGA